MTAAIDAASRVAGPRGGRLVLVLLAVLVAMIGSDRLTASAEAAPKVVERVLTEDRTIRPQRSVKTNIICPGQYVPLTWGYRPLSPSQPGVSVSALLTAVKPSQKGGKNGFAITLFNPNPAATVQMRVSTTCIRGEGRLRVRAAKKGKKPMLTVETASKKLAVGAGRRVVEKVACPSDKAFVADVGFSSERSEYVGYLGGKARGRAAARVVVQNRTSSDDAGRVFVSCISGRRLKLSERLEEGEVVSAGAAAMLPDASASAKLGLRLVRTGFSSALPGIRQGSFFVFCGDPQAAPKVGAIAAGPESLIGPSSGPALQQFVTTRLPTLVTDTGAGQSRAGRRVEPGLPLQSRTLFGHANGEAGPTEVRITSLCIKGRGGLETTVDAKSAIEFAELE